MGSLIWVVVGAAALSFFFALAGTSLRVARRTQLEEALSGERGRRRLALLARHLPQLRLTAALLRAMSNLLLTVALLFVFGAGHPQAGPWRLIGAVATAAAIITVFGMVIPQAWGTHAAESVALATLGVLAVCRWALWPVVAVMAALDVPIRRLSGVTEEADENGEAAKAEILHAASEGRAEGAVDAEEVEMIESIIEFGDRQVDEIMTPRTEIFAVPAEMGWKEACRRIVAAGHTRVPVYEGDLDNIIGVLYAKDLLGLLEAQEPAALRQLMRKCYFVPETMLLGDLLREFKRRKVHIAVVLDEYGGTAGLATIEDVLEEIVGDIADEYDQPEPPQLKVIDERTVEVDARIRVDEVNDEMGLELPEDEDYDTAAGLVFSELGYVPAVGEKLETRGARFTVLAADERRIIRLRVEKLRPDGQAEE